MRAGAHYARPEYQKTPNFARAPPCWAVGSCWLSPVEIKTPTGWRLSAGSGLRPPAVGADTVATRPASGGGELRPQRRGERKPYRGYRAGGGGVGQPSRNPPSTARFGALRRWRPADPARAAGGGWLPGSCRLRWPWCWCWLRPPAVGADTVATPASRRRVEGCDLNGSYRRIAANN